VGLVPGPGDASLEDTAPSSRTQVAGRPTKFRLRVMLAAQLSRTRVVIDPNTPYQQFFHCEVGEPKHIMGRFVPHE
jgi:hypothetical protein